MFSKSLKKKLSSCLVVERNYTIAFKVFKNILKYIYMRIESLEKVDLGFWDNY